jgi:hypothetical protein
MMKCGIASLSHFYKIDRIPSFEIHYFLFDIRYLSNTGGFAFLEFLLRFDQPFVWPSAALNTDPTEAGKASVSDNMLSDMAPYRV